MQCPSLPYMGPGGDSVIYLAKICGNSFSEFIIVVVCGPQLWSTCVCVSVCLSVCVYEN